MFEDDEDDSAGGDVDGESVARPVTAAGGARQRTNLAESSIFSIGDSAAAADSVSGDDGDDSWLSAAAARAEAPKGSATVEAAAEEASAVKRRRIPGPAGLRRRGGAAKRRATGGEAGERSCAGERGGASSQAADDASFPDGLWRHVLGDHDQDETDPNALVNRYNIAWIRRRTSPGLLKRSPVLFCILKSIDLSHTDPKVELQDRSGVVTGMVHRDVVENHGPCLVPGAAMVIKNLQVIMTLGGNHVVVTMDNLACLYRNDAQSSSSGNVKLSKEDLERIAKACEQFERNKLRPLAEKAFETAAPSGRPVVPSPRTANASNHRSVMQSLPSVPPNFRPEIASTPMTASALPSSSSSATQQQPKPPSYRFKRPLPPPTPPTFNPEPLTQEEETARELLEGIDEESLFGDF